MASNASSACQRGSGLSTWSAELLIALGYSQDLYRRERCHFNLNRLGSLRASLKKSI
jgi:hypothetical protein